MGVCARFAIVAVVASSIVLVTLPSFAEAAADRPPGVVGEVEVEVEDEDVGPTPTPNACTPADQCCKICEAGKACGKSCIQASKTCHKGRGCACNSSEVCAN